MSVMSLSFLRSRGLWGAVIVAATLTVAVVRAPSRVAQQRPLRQAGGSRRRIATSTTRSTRASAVLRMCPRNRWGAMGVPFVTGALAGDTGGHHRQTRSTHVEKKANGQLGFSASSTSLSKTRGMPRTRAHRAKLFGLPFNTVTSRTAWRPDVLRAASLGVEGQPARRPRGLERQGALPGHEGHTH